MSLLYSSVNEATLVPGGGGGGGGSLRIMAYTGNVRPKGDFIGVWKGR